MKPSLFHLLPFLFLLALSIPIALRNKGVNIPIPSLEANAIHRRAQDEIPLPPVIENNLADVFDDNGGGDGTTTPFFWHVPKSAGSTIKDLYAACFGLTLACEIGALEGHDQDQELAVVEMNGGLHYVNVDLDTYPGILRAQELNLAQSNLADIIITTHIHEVSTNIFTPTNRGKMFALFRHPVDRVVSLFYYLKGATWEVSYNEIYQHMTLQEYAYSPYCESNIMVRTLAQNPESPITQEDLEISKEIIRKKCLVGLVNEMEESVRRFNLYFGFERKESDGLKGVDEEKCSNQLTTRGGGSNQNKHPDYERSGKTWKKLMLKNWADIILYEYAEQLFMEQKELVEGLALQ